MASDGLPPLRDVIAKFDLAAKKALGQNFLLDLNLTARIARAAGAGDGGTFYEVGPGPGGLTRALLAQGAGRVVAVERDERCLPALAEIAAAYPGRLEVICGDAMAMDEAALFPTGARIAANLPYNVGTALLVRWLTSQTWPPFWKSCTLMFQKEVAQRITARPGTEHYGRLAVLTGWRATAKIQFDVPKQAFVPPPKITSSVVRLEPRAEPLAPCALADLERVSAAAFGQRRKMLRQSLKSLPADPLRLAAAAGVDPTRRAETVPISGFVAMARELADIRKQAE